MELSERLGWLLLGMALGFVLGFIVARLRSIEQKVDTVDEHIKRTKSRDERGFMRLPLVADVLYILVLVIVVAGAFSAQKASNEVKETQEELTVVQDRLEHVTNCNRVYLRAMLRAVEPRTTAAQQQATANVELQKAWYRFVKFQLHIPPYPEAQRRERANVYAEALGNFVEAAEKSRLDNAENPYPTEDQFDRCVNAKENQDE